MALDESALSELLDALRRSDGVDLVRELAEWALQQLVEAEATVKIGAGRYERTEGRVTERNGHRPKVLTTKAGDLNIGIPKLREGSFFPSLLAPRRRIDQALHAVVMEAYIAGVSTRSVDSLVEAMGAQTGVSKSEVSRICAQLDERVAAFRNRTLGHLEFPYVYLDATYVHVRDEDLGQVVSRAVVIATGVNNDGHREVLGVEIRRLGERDVLDQLLALAEATRAGRCAPGDLRRSRRTEGGDPQELPGSVMATLPRSLRPQPARHRPEGVDRGGRRRVPVDLRAHHRG